MPMTGAHVWLRGHLWLVTAAKNAWIHIHDLPTADSRQRVLFVWSIEGQPAAHDTSQFCHVKRWTNLPMKIGWIFRNAEFTRPARPVKIWRPWLSSRLSCGLGLSTYPEAPNLFDIKISPSPAAWPWGLYMYMPEHFDGLMQERRNSIANALELRLSCTNPLTWFFDPIVVILSLMSMVVLGKRSFMC